MYNITDNIKYMLLHKYTSIYTTDGNKETFKSSVSKIQYQTKTWVATKTREIK